MRDFTKSLHAAPAFPILELVKELTVGQRSTDRVELLSDFLHTKIFPKLGPFFTEIYFPDASTGNFVPSEPQDHSTDNTNSVPELIPGDLPIVKDIMRTHRPVEILYRSQEASSIFTVTKNSSQLLVPIPDCTELSGLLYLGSASPCSFSPDFMSAIETLAAVIGSRLKSMGIICQLKGSMQELEHSDRLRTALYEISEQAHCSKNITDLYSKLHEKVAHLIQARNFFIALVEEGQDGQQIKFPYYVDENDTQFQGMELQLDREKCSITGHLLRTRQPLLLTPTNFDRICLEHNITCVGTRPHAWLGAPFFVGDITGVVAIQSYNDVVYTEKDKELMAFVARHIGEALARKHSVDQLKKAKEAAELAERNKSIFLANMSHEIRTPMNGIIGLTDLVLHSDISGQQRSYLEMVYSSAERLLKLINDILDFSKIEAGKLELDIAPFRLRSTIAGALEILAISAAKKNIALTVDCDDDIPDVLLGDAGKLSQILINLVGNGVKFTTEGSVALLVRQLNQRRTQSENVDLQFQIRDTGIGIPEAHTKKIFKAFSQVVTNQSTNQRGTGLGLVIAGELVELMGGKIRVLSTQGVGTSFYFTVTFTPVATSETEQTRGKKPPKTSPKAQSYKKPLHILLVEDEYINRVLAVTILEREGWKVEVAENGNQAIHRLRENIFDLILMDIQMPELDGYETTRVIRQQERETKRHTPIIAMTAYAVKGDLEKCLAAGMDGYIAKPIHPDKLSHEIENVLRYNLPGQAKPHTP